MYIYTILRWWNSKVYVELSNVCYNLLQSDSMRCDSFRQNLIPFHSVQSKITIQSYQFVILKARHKNNFQTIWCYFFPKSCVHISMLHLIFHTIDFLTQTFCVTNLALKNGIPHQIVCENGKIAYIQLTMCANAAFLLLKILRPLSLSVRGSVTSLFSFQMNIEFAHNEENKLHMLSF